MNEKKKEDKELTCRIQSIDANTVKISKREVSLHPPLGSNEIVSISTASIIFNSTCINIEALKENINPFGLI